MVLADEYGLIRRRYRQVYECNLEPSFGTYAHSRRCGETRAQVGYRRATTGPLFLESYLDRPVEDAVSAALGRPIGRDSIVEIGNLAADDAFALVQLWAGVANDLGATCEVAVATLTAPLRAMFVRLGVPILELGVAHADRAAGGTDWGSYYAADPRVCVGSIAQGQSALAAFFARRRSQAA